jgi:hypothetical protein
MRLEIIDLKEDTVEDDLNNDDDLASWLAEDDQRSEDFYTIYDDTNGDPEKGQNRSRSGSRAMFLSDDDDDNEKAVTMKDDILTAVTDMTNTRTTQGFVGVVPNIAPIAPLPSRLSFCLSPQRQQQLDAMLAAASGDSGSCSSGSTSRPKVAAASSPSNKRTSSTAAVVVECQLESDEVTISPTKKLLNYAGGDGSSSGCSISMVAKRSPTVAPSVVPRLLAKNAVTAVSINSAEVLDEIAIESPSKRKLRISVSCDNYLGDGKFSLSRRDSVGSGSPHSSKVIITPNIVHVAERC